MKKEEIAIILTHGNEPNPETSIQDTQWLGWEKISAGGRIQHGEAKKRLESAGTLDGRDEQAKIINKYNGWVFHRHPECAKEEDWIPLN